MNDHAKIPRGLIHKFNLWARLCQAQYDILGAGRKHLQLSTAENLGMIVAMGGEAGRTFPGHAGGGFGVCKGCFKLFCLKAKIPATADG
jgi:hypothetical protein